MGHDGLAKITPFVLSARLPSYELGNLYRYDYLFRVELFMRNWLRNFLP
jgi:hypothetical protein